MKRYSTILIAPIILIVTYTLIGWMFNIEFLIRPVWGDVTMNPTTALCMFYLSLAFLLSLWLPAMKTTKVISTILTAIVIIVSAAKLLTLIGIDLGIDRILLREHVLYWISQGLRSRMAPNTALNFLLIGFIMLLPAQVGKKMKSLSNAAALLVFFIALFSFIGHVYRVKEYNGIFNYIPMALETSLCFILFSMTLILERRREGFMEVISSRNMGGVIARQMIPAVILIPTILGFLRLWIWWHLDFSVELGIAALITSIISISLLLLWYFARALNIADEDRKAGEAQLKRQAALLHMMPGGVVYMSIGRRFIDINEAAEKMFDLQKKDVIGKPVEEILALNFLTSTDPMSRHNEFLQKGYWVGEIEITNRETGKKITVVTHNRAIENVGDGVSGHMMVYTDITERKAIEERMSLAIEGTAGAIWDWNIADMISWWSPRYFELLGYMPDEIKPSQAQFRQLLHPGDRGTLVDAMERHFKEQKEQFEMEARFQTKSGTYKWFQVFAHIKYDGQGSASRMTGSIIDIDDKKKVQEIVELQAGLFDIMPDATIYGKRDLSITNINAAAELLFERKKEEAIGKKFDDIISLEVLGISRQDARKELWGNVGFWRGEGIITTHTGNKAKVLISLKSIKDKTGEFTGFVGIYTNITMLQINEDLKEALRKQDDNNKYLEQLAYISTHDLKAPIVTANSLVDIIVRNNGVKDEFQEMIGMVKGTMEQMKRTNSALNDIIKVRRDLVDKKGTQGLELQPLTMIVNDVKTTLQKNIEEKEGSLHISIEGSENLKFPYVHIKSVLYNLLSNSIKYADPTRSPKVSLYAERLADGGIRLVIEDNGLGINLNDHREKLYGVFKRFHSHVEGTGVGLHIVKSIVEIYDGQIDVKSAVGFGTSFDICFTQSKLAEWN